MITFEQLLYAEVLSHHPSMQVAADILHITKSGLSLAIKQLEDELGLQIFERTSRGTILTPEGIKILAAITEVLHAKNNLLNTASIIKNARIDEKVKINYINTLLKPFIHVYLGEFQKEYPDLMINFCCSKQNVILEAVRNKQIDVGFIAMPKDLSDLGEELTFEQVCHSRIVLICSSDNPLLSKEKITLNDIKQQKFCLFDDESYQYIFDQLEYMCGPLPLIFKTDDAHAMEEAINKFNAVTFIRMVDKELSYSENLKELNYISIEHLVDDHSALAWVYNTHRQISKPTRDLMTLITNQLKKDIR